MSSPSPARGPARETRLLLLTLFVSVAVLFLLARFRFPARPISELAAPQPLARLARATTFDDQSAALAELLRRAGESSVTLRVGSASGDGNASGTGAASGSASRGRIGSGSGPASGSGGGAGAGADAGAAADVDAGADAPPISRFVPALRVRDDLALAVLPGDVRVEAIDGAAVSESPSASPIVARDEVRGLALVRVPAKPTPTLAVQPSGEALELPGFVAVMDATPGGPTIQAEFVSRAGTQPHPAWDATIITLGLGGAQPRPGSMVFTLAGRFIGLVLPDGGETLIAPGDALIARADRLAHGESVLAANAGLAVQPLSPSIAKATHASNGVVIAAIESPAAALRVGDVIAAIDNDAIRSVADWERALNRRAPGTTAQLQIVRREGTQQIPLTLKWRDVPLAPGDNGAAAAAASAKRNDTAAGGLGLTLRPNGIGLEIQRIAPGSTAARAGLQIGDRITALPYAAAAAATSKATKAAAKAAARSTAAANAAGASTASTKATPAGATASGGTPAASTVVSALAPAPTNAPLTVARVEAAFKALVSGDALLLAINRGGQPLIVAIEKP